MLILLGLIAPHFCQEYRFCLVYYNYGYLICFMGHSVWYMHSKYQLYGLYW